MEIFKPVPVDKYKELYEVGNKGSIKSFSRTYYSGEYYKIKKTNEEKCMKLGYDKDGYLLVGLTKDGATKTYKVHRLVAMAFIPNPYGYLIVNHKNGIRDDNRVENLEWCTNQYNIEYSLAKPIMGINKLDGEVVIFKSCREVDNYGFDHSAVIKCCKGRQNSHKGYTWAYIERNDNDGD